MFQSLNRQGFCAILLIALSAAQPDALQTPTLNTTTPESDLPTPTLNTTTSESDSLNESSHNETHGMMHVFITCGNVFGANFRSLNTGAMDYLTDTFCSGLERYVSCVREGLTNPTTLIDHVIQGLINKDAVLPSFQNACAVRSVWIENAECIRNQSLLMSNSCNNYFNHEISQLNQGFSALSLCGSYVFSINCLADAFSACSSDVSNIYRFTYLNFLTEECRNGTQT